MHSNTTASQNGRNNGNTQFYATIMDIIHARVCSGEYIPRAVLELGEFAGVARTKTDECGNNQCTYSIARA